ncbi:alpha-amylase A type-3 [Lingula anatina]|uniref:alpha-amylase n=1 Tax=Lingula anatina TaxID=7574 RepID=A0A1S3GXM2_LINAN|nr:alpha-amylase A type-3 [Lingula anatina]|eukprot:XP_013378610.1 alpha-amylase A type-3 [Lingula anatina]
MVFSLKLMLLLLPAVLCGKTVEEWKGRIIYQILTDRFSPHGPTPSTPCTALRSYCGGKFKGIQQRLDYIKGLGANAIWISPIVLNTPGGFHGYWAKNIYEINPEFGTKQDLKDLIKACHDKDIWVMVDVVPNHMGYNDGCFWNNPCTPTKLNNFTGFVPFDKPEYYHQYCEIMDWNNQTEVEFCRLAHLPDLSQENDIVKRLLLDWIGNLTINYDIDGYRIDTLKLVPKWFWSEFQARAGAYCIGEATGSDPQYVAGYQDSVDGLLNFPMYNALRDVFNENKSIRNLTKKIQEQRRYFKELSRHGLFLDNHDQRRFLNWTSDYTVLKNALTYVILGEGIPIIYYGTEQGFSGGHDPNDRESLWPYYSTQSDIYKFIAGLTKLRLSHLSHFVSGGQREMAANDDFFVFTRGKENQFLVVLTNRGNTSGTLEWNVQVPVLKAETVYKNFFDETDTVTVDNGTLKLKLTGGLPKVFLAVQTPTSKAERSSGVTWKLVFVCILLLHLLSLE